MRLKALLSAFLLWILFAGHTYAQEEVVVLQPGPGEGKDIWTTSVFCYCPGGGGPGGGRDDHELVVGGWGDLYHSLLEFDLTGMPPRASSARLEFFTFTQRGVGTTGMYLDRITEFWDWRTQGTGQDRERLWWADRPAAVQWIPHALPAPTVGQWYSIDITDLYNAWQDGTYPNYGIQLRPVSNDNRWAEFYSSDYTGDPSLRPKLIVEIPTSGIVYLLLHGTASGPDTWDNLVRDRFGNDCPVTRLGEAITKESFCYRHEFEDKSLAGNQWRNGDGSTFTELGDEVTSIVQKIEEKVHPAAVILVAHSRGGLAARAYIQGLTIRPSFELGLLTIGTPHQGTPLGRAKHWLLDHGYIPENFQTSRRVRILCSASPIPSDCRYNLTSLLFSPSVGYQATEHDESGKPIRTPISIAIWQLNDGVDLLGRWVSTIGQIYSSRLRLGEDAIGRYDLLADSTAFSLRSIIVPGDFHEMRRFILLNIGDILNLGTTDSWVCTRAQRRDADDWACNGDGIVPAISQQLTRVPGFSIGRIPWHPKELSKVSHADVFGDDGETGQFTAIKEVLELMSRDFLR